MNMTSGKNGSKCLTVGIGRGLPTSFLPILKNYNYNYSIHRQMHTVEVKLELAKME